MFGSLNTNMRRVIECLEPLDHVVRAQFDSDTADDSEEHRSQFDAVWSNVEQALKNLHDSVLEELKQQVARTGDTAQVGRPHVIDAVDYGIYRGEAGQIVLRDVIHLLSGLTIPAVTVVHFSRDPFKASMLYGFGNSATCSLLAADRLPKHHSAVFPARDADWAILQRLTVAESSLKEAILKRK